MEPTITGRNLKLSPRTQDYVKRKLEKISRHLPGIIETKVEISEEQTRSPEQRFVVQVTIDSSGLLLRGEERADTLPAAVDKVIDVLDGRIEHYKGKLQIKGRETPRNPEEVSAISAGEEEALKKVKRVKKFTLKPMSRAQAIDQMELLRHDFFLFIDSDTDDVNLLYRRKDGNYGLIQTEIEE